MLNATMKPLLSNKSYIHIRKPGFPVKMRDLFYYFLTILKAHSSFRFRILWHSRSYLSYGRFIRQGLCDPGS